MKETVRKRIGISGADKGNRVQGIDTGQEQERDIGSKDLSQQV